MFPYKKKIKCPACPPSLKLTALIASLIPKECKQAIISSQEDKQGIKV